MSKIAAGFMAILVLLLCLQTWRLVHTQQMLEARMTTASEQLAPKNSATITPAVTAAKTNTEVSSTKPAKSLDGASSDNSGLVHGAGENLSGSAGEGGGLRRRSEAGKKASQDSQEDADAAKRAEANRTIDMARKRMREGNASAAIELLTHALREDATNARAYRELARVYQQLGMSAEELVTLQDWQANVPTDIQAHIRLAAAYEAQGLTAEALAELGVAESLTTNPGDFRAMAQLYNDLGIPTEEGAALEAWTQADPQSVEARVALADYYRRNQDPMAAIEQYQLALTAAPGNTQAALGLAAMYERTRQYDLAQSQLLDVVEQRPGEMQAWMMLAENYRRAGDLNSAASTYQMVIDMRPDSTEAIRADRALDRIERQIQRNNSQKTIVAALSPV